RGGIRLHFTIAGQMDSPWNQRLKVPLYLWRAGGVIEARVPGRDGSPTCANRQRLCGLEAKSDTETERHRGRFKLSAVFPGRSSGGSPAFLSWRGGFAASRRVETALSPYRAARYRPASRLRAYPSLPND